MIIIIIIIIIIIVVVVIVVVVVVFRSIFTSYYFVQPTSYYTIQRLVGIRLRVTTLLHSVLYCKILQRISVTSLQTSPYSKLLFSVLQLYDSVLQGQQYSVLQLYGSVLQLHAICSVLLAHKTCSTMRGATLGCQKHCNYNIHVAIATSQDHQTLPLPRKVILQPDPLPRKGKSSDDARNETSLPYLVILACRCCNMDVAVIFCFASQKGSAQCTRHFSCHDDEP